MNFDLVTDIQTKYDACEPIVVARWAQKKVPVRAVSVKICRNLKS